MRLVPSLIGILIFCLIVWLAIQLDASTQGWLP